MNVNDTDVVWSILKDAGYLKTESIQEADVILVVTCAIREGAETKVWNKLKHFKALKKAREKQNLKPQLKIGILGRNNKKLQSVQVCCVLWKDVIKKVKLSSCLYPHR
jgi:tRNA A37 methylthiotransferase MiaB